MRPSVRAAGSRGRGAADRLREPRQPDPRPRRRAAARAGGARVAGGEPRPPGPPDAGGDRVLCAAGECWACCSGAGSSSCRPRPGPRSCPIGCASTSTGVGCSSPSVAARRGALTGLLPACAPRAPTSWPTCATARAAPPARPRSGCSRRLVVGQIALARAAGGRQPDDAQLPAAAGGALGVGRGVAAHAALLHLGRRLRPARAAGRVPAQLEERVRRCPVWRARRHLQHPDRRRRRSGAARDRPPAGGARRRAGRDPDHRLAAALRDAGAPLLEGRSFKPEEHASPTADVAVVNRALARRFLPDGAIGQRLGSSTGRCVTTRPSWLRVVGVSPDLQYEEFGEDTAVAPQRVPPYARPALAGAAGANEDAAAAQAEAVRRVFRDADLGLSIWDVRTMDEVRAFTTLEQRFFGQLMGAFAARRCCSRAWGLRRAGLRRQPAHPRDRRAPGAGRAAARRHRAVVAARLPLGVAGRGLGLCCRSAWAGRSGRPLRSGPVGPAAARSRPRGSLLIVVTRGSLLPARRAAAVDPIAALRAE